MLENLVSGVWTMFNYIACFYLGCCFFLISIWRRRFEREKSNLPTSERTNFSCGVPPLLS